MKKIFFFAAAAMAALTINAQQITFSEVAAKGTLNGAQFSDGEFVLTVTDTDAAKLEIDANNCLFGDEQAQVKFTHRLKTGGKSSSKNLLTLSIPTAGKLYIYARTGSNSALDRNIILTQDSKVLVDKILLESEAIKVAGLDSDDPAKESNVYAPIICDVEEGDIEITYPVNGVNFYAFSLNGPAVEPSQPIDPSEGVEEVAGAVKAQKVVENGQLIIIKNGVRFNAVGAQL